jgi:hypothetical protein
VLKGAGDASPELVVKWNEKKDVIAPRVREERERIERLVQGQGARDRSPTPSLAASMRKNSVPTTEEPEKEPVDTEDENSHENVGDTGGKEYVSDGSTESAAAGVPNDKEDTAPLSLSTEDGQVAVALAAAVTDDEVSTETQPEASAEGQTEGLATQNNAQGEDDGFGDDFDDFGEAVEADGGDDFNDFDDFGGFEDGDASSGFDEPVPAPEPAPPPPPPQALIPQLPVPLPDFGDPDGVNNVLSAAVEKMFPISGERRKPTSVEGRSFLTDRSQSLWNQLVAPPPLQPPNWKISRIRRLFLVSLGIPLDLDEILPTETKQKKLVLPSVHLSRQVDSRPSSRNSSRRSGSLSRKKRGDDKDTIKPDEVLDIPSARILCSTSAMALRGFPLQELREHIRKLEEITAIASEVLTYWLGKRDGAVGDKETFETVIESLVGYARKKRQNG